jgi:transposase
MSRVLLRYSEAFKTHVIGQLERGELRSHGEAQARYGINGHATISKWLRKHGKNHLVGKVVRVETPDEVDQVKKLRARIRDLEHALADSKVQEVLHRAFFELVCEEHALDPEAVKKNIEERRSREEPGLPDGKKA